MQRADLEVSQTSGGPPVVSVLGLLEASDVVHSLSGDDTQVSVAARAEVTHDACMDGDTQQFLRLVQLTVNRTEGRRQRPESAFYFSLVL